MASVSIESIGNTSLPLESTTPPHPMKKLLLIVAALGLSCGLYAGDGKEVTLEGTGMCAKCELGVSEKCTNVLQVTKDDGAVMNYTFTKNVDHGKYFCQGTTENLTVVGTVKEMDGEMKLTAKSVTAKEG